LLSFRFLCVWSQHGCCSTVMSSINYNTNWTSLRCFTVVWPFFTRSRCDAATQLRVAVKQSQSYRSLLQVSSHSYVELSYMSAVTAMYSLAASQHSQPRRDSWQVISHCATSSLVANQQSQPRRVSLQVSGHSHVEPRCKTSVTVT